MLSKIFALIDEDGLEDGLLITGLNHPFGIFAH